MTIVRELGQLPALLAKLNLNSSKKIISIDGFFGAAKNMVSAYLTEALSIPAVYVDDFLARDGASLETFNFKGFSGTITKLNQSSSIIVDGIMVQDILARTGTKADFLIYVKRVNPYGIWHDDFKIDKLLRSDETHATAKYDPLEEEVVQYHLRVRPHERAHIVVELVEGPS